MLPTLPVWGRAVPSEPRGRQKGALCIPSRPAAQEDLGLRLEMSSAQGAWETKGRPFLGLGFRVGGVSKGIGVPSQKQLGKKGRRNPLGNWINISRKPADPSSFQALPYLCGLILTPHRNSLDPPFRKIGINTPASLARLPTSYAV